MSLMAAKRISVDIVSDTVCPWCFVGKRRLDLAMTKLKSQGVDFDVRWFPYQLNPSASTKGVNKLEMYKDKFGEAKIAQMLPHMTQVFADLGLTYSIGGLTGNTLDSHRLIHYAGKVSAEVQNAVVEELFKGYFTEEKYINDREVLLAAASAAGLQGAKEFLADPTNSLAEVHDLLLTKTKGINGVPHFTINNKYKLSGAQEPETFVQVFLKALQEEDA